MIEVIALILKHRRLAEHGKAMCEPLRDEELSM
jgi:hypothetical protein